MTPASMVLFGFTIKYRENKRESISAHVKAAQDHCSKVPVSWSVGCSTIAASIAGARIMTDGDAM
jgi:hypothetical protein